MTVPGGWSSAPFTPGDARRAGVSRKQLDALVASGELRRLTRGYYSHPEETLDQLERVRELSKVLPPHHVVCDRTAAWVHGVDVYDAPGVCAELPLSTVALRGHSRTVRTEFVSGSRDLLVEDIMRVAGVQVTTPVRTVVDLMCRLRERPALAMYDAFLRRGLVTVDEVALHAVRHRGRRGIRRARPLIPLGTSRSESAGESFTRWCIINAGLPAPEPQFKVWHAGRLLFRLDLAYAALKIAVEYDGDEFHGPDREEHDSARRAWLREDGWHVIVVRKHQLGEVSSREWLEELTRERATRLESHQRYSRIARRAQR